MNPTQLPDDWAPMLPVWFRTFLSHHPMPRKVWEWLLHRIGLACIWFAFLRLRLQGRWLLWTDKWAVRRAWWWMPAWFYNRIWRYVLLYCMVLKWKLQRRWRRLFGTSFIEGPDREIWPRPAWPLRAAIWLRLAPWEVGQRLSGWNVDLWSVVSAGAVNLTIWAHRRHKSAIQQTWPGGAPDSVFRAFEILYFEQEERYFENVQPYDPVADASAIWRAVWPVAATSVALVLILAGVLAMPSALPYVQALEELARASLSGWQR